MPASNFTHLHVHSEYSLLDGACRIQQIVDAAKEYRMHSIALTDHGNMFGAIEFYSTAIKNGIKPIVGYEAYVAPGNRTERAMRKGLDPYYHLTLLAKNETGYKNLIRLASIAYQEGFYYKPRIDKESLEKHKDGIIALSGCLSSEMARLITNGKNAEAETVAGFYAELLGKDNFFLEIQDHGIPEQRKVVTVMAELSKKLGLGLAATNDVHYPKKDDHKFHDILMAISEAKLVRDTNRKRLSTSEFFLKSQQEMGAIFAEFPESLSNTGEIASRCNLSLELGAKHLPRFNAPDGKTINAYLRELAEAGMKNRYRTITPPMKERMEFELDTISKMGFSSYFLIVWDFVRFAKSRSIPVGPGRGSAAGSLVSYCLGITNIDPFRYGLLFERFLNPSRHEMPDIDIDFCKLGRDEVIAYVRDHYGKESVSQVGTFSKMKARAAVKDVGRTLGIPADQVNLITKKIPGDPDILLKDALSTAPDLNEQYRSSPVMKELFDYALKIEGFVRHVSVHAAAVVIADMPLTEYSPIYVNNSVENTQYPAEALQALGLLKMDFLGLQTLTIIDHAIKLIKKTRGVDIDPDAIPFDDKKSYEMIGRGDNTGLFQIESSGFRDLCKKMGPDKFEDLIALIALFRPGPLQSGLLDTFVACKNGMQEISYLHPALEPILKETYGVIVYQEQVMQISSAVGGFSPSDADSLRKAMGKKKPEVLADYREKFEEFATKKKKIPNDVAVEIFNRMEFFGGYGFNKSHSAGYAVLLIRTAYLKANFPEEYMCTLLTIDMENTDKLTNYFEECSRLKIEVLPPDINASVAEFAIEGPGKIRFGLQALKGVGMKAIEAVLVARKRAGGRFKSFYHLLEECDLRAVDKRVLDAMIKAGAFDSLGMKRSQAAMVLDTALSIAQKISAERKSGQTFLFSGKATGASATFPEVPDIDEWPEDMKWSYEKEAFGFFMSAGPLSKNEALIRTFATVTSSGLKNCREGDVVLMGGIITHLEERTVKGGTRKGSKWAKMRFRDLDGACGIFAYANEFIQYADYLTGDAVVFLEGSVDYRTEEPAVKVLNVMPVEKFLEGFVGYLGIKFASSDLSENLIQTLQALFRAHPGNCPVMMKVVVSPSSETLLQAGKEFKVVPSAALLESLAHILPEGSYRFVRKKNGN